MKQKFLKIAAVFAAVMAVVAYLPVTVPVAETAMTVWADNELPFVPIGNNSYKFTNNTDYVTAMWKDNSPLNMNILRKTALNLVSQSQYGRISKKKLMFKAALDPDLFLKIIFFPKK